jgi:dethiobiotin synthetase
VNVASGRPFDFDVSRLPELPRAKGIFVTGTDTAVGKTLIAGAIARNLRRAGWDVEVFKPVATGCRRSRGQLVSEDAEFLAVCADSRLALAEITPVCFSAAAAPNVAAEHEGLGVDIEAIFSLYRYVVQRSEAVVVEGVGGLLCPISDDFWVIHLAAILKLPLVIVATAALGTINHTLLTILAARAAGLDVAGVVLNRYLLEPNSRRMATGLSSDEELAMYTNPSQIAARGNVQVLAVVPEEQENSISQAVIGPGTQFAIDQVDWAGIIQRHAATGPVSRQSRS